MDVRVIVSSFLYKKSSTRFFLLNPPPIIYETGQNPHCFGFVLPIVLGLELSATFIRIGEYLK